LVLLSRFYTSATANGTATLDDANKRGRDAPIVPSGHVWRTDASLATALAFTGLEWRVPVRDKHTS
jgi:hypothetical protein